MHVRNFGRLLVLVFAGFAPLHGQDQLANENAGPAIATDRPTFANSSIVVPAGSRQGENGVLTISNLRQSIFDGPESLMRFGVAKKTELRLSMPNYLLQPDRGGWRRVGVRRLGRGSSAATWAHAGRIRRIGDRVRELSDWCSGGVQRRVRSWIAGGVVARANEELDGGGSAVAVRADSGSLAERDWRAHDLCGPAAAWALGCVYGIRGGFSGKGRFATIAAFRDEFEDRQEPTDGLAHRSGLVADSGGSFRWSRVLVSISGGARQVTCA